MGCGSVNKSRVVSPIIELAMETSGLAEADSLLFEATDPLKQIKLKAGSLDMSISSFKALCRVDNLRHPTLSDAVLVLAFCIATASRGHLETASFRITEEEPFIHFNSNLPANCSELITKWVRLADTLTQTSSLVSSFMTSCRQATEMGDKFNYNAMLEHTQLSVAEASKAVRTCHANLMKLKSSIAVVRKIEEHCTETWNSIKQGGVYLASQEGTAYLRGLVQKTAGQHVTPELCVKMYWPDMARLTSLTIA
jgi:hypothetical protein